MLHILNFNLFEFQSIFWVSIVNLSSKIKDENTYLVGEIEREKFRHGLLLWLQDRSITNHQSESWTSRPWEFKTGKVFCFVLSTKCITIKKFTIFRAAYVLVVVCVHGKMLFFSQERNCLSVSLSLSLSVSHVFLCVSVCVCERVGVCECVCVWLRCL